MFALLAGARCDTFAPGSNKRSTGKLGSRWSVYRKMVGPNGFEPATSRLSGVRSNQLSYGPFKKCLATINPSSTTGQVYFSTYFSIRVDLSLRGSRHGGLAMVASRERNSCGILAHENRPKQIPEVLASTHKVRPSSDVCKTVMLSYCLEGGVVWYR